MNLFPATQAIKTMLFVFLISGMAACSEGGRGDSSVPTSPTTSDQGANTGGLPNARPNCGDKICDAASAFCFQKVASSNVINISECGLVPGSACVIWQKDISRNSTVLKSECIAVRDVRDYRGCFSAASHVLHANRDVCLDSIGCETRRIGRGADSRELSVVSCFTK